MERSAEPEQITIRLAAAGDLHCRSSHRSEVVTALEGVSGTADLLLLAGDLTADGDRSQAEVLAGACQGLAIPVFAVLGNHDWHRGQQAEIAETLRRAGVTMLDGEAATLEVQGHEVGIAGAKGFVGGFPPNHLPDFGEPSLRDLYAETSAEAEALDAALREIETCTFRIALLHYSPTEATLRGERPEIWTFLGSSRLAAPILEHCPDLVLHGHAHSGSLQGRLGPVPVYNVAVPVIGPELWRLELSAPRSAAPIH